MTLVGMILGMTAVHFISGEAQSHDTLDIVTASSVTDSKNLSSLVTRRTGWESPMFRSSPSLLERHVPIL